MLHGIALSQSGRIDEARGELRRATMLSPTDPRTYYNLAVQLYGEGDRKEAALMAREALRVDPKHEDAQELLKKCGPTPGQAPFEAGKAKIAPTRLSIRPGADDPLPHILGLGVAWTRIGWGLLALCVIEDVLLATHPPFTAAGHMRADSLAVLATFMWIFTGLASLFWMFLDIFDRRKRFVWLLPLSICGIAGLPVIFLGLYLWIGRRQD
jgi:tetratricopeptide (TPR) repeat protein